MPKISKVMFSSRMLIGNWLLKEGNPYLSLASERSNKIPPSQSKASFLKKRKSSLPKVVANLTNRSRVNSYRLERCLIRNQEWLEVYQEMKILTKYRDGHSLRNLIISLIRKSD